MSFGEFSQSSSIATQDLRSQDSDLVWQATPKGPEDAGKAPEKGLGHLTTVEVPSCQEKAAKDSFLVESQDVMGHMHLQIKITIINH